MKSKKTYTYAGDDKRIDYVERTSIGREYTSFEIQEAALYFGVDEKMVLKSIAKYPHDWEKRLGEYVCSINRKLKNA